MQLASNNNNVYLASNKPIPHFNVKLTINILNHNKRFSVIQNCTQCYTINRMTKKQSSTLRLSVAQSFNLKANYYSDVLINLLVVLDK